MPEEQPAPSDAPTQPALTGRPETPLSRTPPSMPAGYLILWVLTLLSLLLNVFMVRQVILARQVARQAVHSAIAVMGDLQQMRLSYEVVVDQAMPIVTDLPVNETIPVTIREQLPISTVVQVPVNAGPFGTLNLDIPIRTTVPLNLDTSVTLNQSFHVDTVVPVRFEVPVEIAVRDTALYATLEDVKARLEALAATLDTPLLPFGGAGRSGRP
jgi:hypothetical protein